MGSLNVCILIGRLTKDPELRYTQSGKPVCRMRLAVDRGTASPEGERETDFIDILAWDKLAENCNTHLQKGRLIGVVGRLQVRQFIHPEHGDRREKAEIVAFNVKFLDRANKAQNGNQSGEQTSNEAAVVGEEFVMDDDDVPF